ncbi:MAG: site-specific integrase [Desulfobacteraceae bacterium]|nr:site-specific integrase [Desulfobacteraceae bacterium]
MSIFKNWFIEYKNYKGYKKNSKRKSLRGLPANWQLQLVDQVSPEYRLNVILIALTGCRPVEFSKIIKDNPPGAIIQIEGGNLKIQLPGGKHDGKHKGHEHRTLYFDPGQNHFAKGLVDLLKDSDDGKRIIGLPEGKTVKQLRDHGWYIGNKLFPGVSLYSLRHAFASNIKGEVCRKSETDFIDELEKEAASRFRLFLDSNPNASIKAQKNYLASSEFKELVFQREKELREEIRIDHKKEIARALGQASTKTQQNYGLLLLGRGGSGMLKAEASGSVKVANAKPFKSESKACTSASVSSQNQDNNSSPRNFPR